MDFKFNFLFACLIATILIAQPEKAESKDFIGEITYTIKYEDDIDPAILAALPKQATLVIKREKSHLKTFSSLGAQSIIYNHKKKESYSLIDLVSPPLAIKKSEIDILNERKQYEIKDIKYTNEHKLILGNKCNKVLITIYISELDESVELEAYYTSTLGLEWINESDPIYYPVKGVLMEYEVQIRSTFIKYILTDILRRKVADRELNIPKGYKMINATDLPSYLKGLK